MWAKFVCSPGFSAQELSVFYILKSPLTSYCICYSFFPVTKIISHSLIFSGFPGNILQETWFGSLGWNDPLEEEMATCSSILAWKIHGERSLEDHNPWGCRVGHDRVTKHPAFLVFFKVLKSLPSILFIYYSFKFTIFNWTFKDIFTSHFSTFCLLYFHSFQPCPQLNFSFIW